MHDESAIPRLASGCQQKATVSCAGAKKISVRVFTRTHQTTEWGERT
jgi:hypothetical protein